METRKLIFITGGVRSGKSSFAEKVAEKQAKTLRLKLHYIACGIPFDNEMKERITRHQEDRDQSGAEWTTWEQATELKNIASSFKQDDLLLVDCITTLLNNYLFQVEGQDCKLIIQRIQLDITSLIQRAGRVIFVSNEVFQDTPYLNKETKDYQFILGKLHQFIVTIADTAILVENGIPIYKKGSLQ